MTLDSDETNVHLSGYMVKGNTLDILGKTKKAIKVYNKALNEVGDHYLLRFNLGLAHWNNGDKKDANDNWEKAVVLNTSHATSHLMLCLYHLDQNHPTQSALAGLYFLLLEPSTVRSGQAAHAVSQALIGRNSRSEDASIQVLINPNAVAEGFGATDLLLKMKLAEMVAEQTDVELSAIEEYAASVETLFGLLNTVESNNKRGIWGNLYVPFFSAIEAAGYGKTFAYVTLGGVDDEAKAWLRNNKEAVEAMLNWMETAE